MNLARMTLVATLFLPLSALAQGFNYGPIIGRGATPDSLIIKWGTWLAGASEVSFKPKGGGTAKTVMGNNSKDHEVVLTGLALDTAYEYTVGSTTSEFGTCPQPGAPMDVAVIGDTRTNTSQHAKMVAQVLGKSPELVLNTGDLATTGNYLDYLYDFFPQEKDLIIKIPFMAAPGNHDASSMETNFGAMFPSPRDSAAGAWKSYHAFTCGNATFIALDSNIVPDAAQKAWLTAKLAAAKADAKIDHVFVYFHHSAYSVGDHGDSTEVQTHWVPLFDAAGSKVQAVFSGHDHIYARMSNGSKTTYVVTGGGGAPLYPTTSMSKGMTMSAKSAYNYVMLHIAGSLVTANVYDDAGMQIDTFSLGTAGGTGGGGTGGTGGGTGAPMGAAPSSGCDMGRGGAGGLYGLFIILSLVWLRRRMVLTDRA